MACENVRSFPNVKLPCEKKITNLACHDHCTCLQKFIHIEADHVKKGILNYYVQADIKQ